MNVFNKRFKLVRSNVYRKNEVISHRGPLISKYLDIMINVLDKSLFEYPRTLGIRLDLRLPEDFCYLNASLISRFVVSLKSKILHDLNRKESKGTRVHKCKLRYFWVKEQSKSKQPHFHMVIFLNYNTYMGLGDYKADGNMASRIQSAWASAISLPIAVAGPLVEFPKNCQYRLFSSALNFEDERNSLIYRMSYLAKVESKRFGSRQRNVGYSIN